MVEYLRIENILNYSYDDEINHEKIENFIKGLKICYQLQSFFFMDGSFDVYIYDISNNHPKLIHKESNFLVEGYFLKSNEGYFIYEYKNLKQRGILEDIVFLELLPEYYHLTFKELDEFNRININKALFTLPSFYYDYHSQKLKKIPRILPKYSEDDIYECGELEFTKIENYGYFFQIKFDNNRYRYVKFKIIFLENSNNIYKKSCYLKSELDDIIEMHNKNNLEIITQKKPLTDNIKDFFGLLPNHQPKEYIANQLLENKKDNIQISQHQTELKNKDQQITTLQQQLQEARTRIKELESTQNAGVLKGLQKVNHDTERTRKFAQIIAKAIWDMDKTQAIRTNDMVQFLKPLIAQFEPSKLPDSDETVSYWLADIKPLHATQAGRPPKNEPLEIPLTFKK